MSSLPREILKLIVTFAMTASNNSIALPCLTGGEAFCPEINTACLLLDRDLYHTARRALFGPANEFLVSKLASWTIPALAASYGALAPCLRERCPASGFSPLISLVTFHLGDNQDPAVAKLRIDAFTNVLGSYCTRRKLRTQKLTIQLANYSFRSDGSLLDFCVALAKGVDVGKGLCVEGLDVHLELYTRALAVFTRMVLQPVKWQVTFRTDDWRQLGNFRAEYVKDTKAAEKEEGYGHGLKCVYWMLRQTPFLTALAEMSPRDREPMKGGIEDPQSEYWDWLENAPQDWITNGLDYVTEHTLEI